MIGVLALQGDFDAHAKAFGAVRVRTPREIDLLDGLILPGGESTTMLKLSDGIPEATARLLERGGWVFGTCAGAILLAREVLNPPQSSWGFLDATIERNAYGRQVDSFDSPLGPFIRAPIFRRLGPDVEVLATWQDRPVLVRQGRVAAATYHPELSARPELPF